MGDGAWHNDASRTITPPVLPAADVLHSLLNVARHSAVTSCASFYVRASLVCSVATSITASTVELCCEEPRLGSHNILPHHQWPGACLSGSLAACGPAKAISPDLRSPPLHNAG